VVASVGNGGATAKAGILSDILSSSVKRGLTSSIRELAF